MMLPNGSVTNHTGNVSQTSNSLLNNPNTRTSNQITTTQSDRGPIMPGRGHPSQGYIPLIFTYEDLIQKRVTVEQVLNDYARKPVDHRGNREVKNEAEFNAVVRSARLAENGNFTSTVATLGVALHAMTGGRHPKVDWRHPVRIPRDHPPIPNFARIIGAMQMFGFPNFQGYLEARPYPAEDEVLHVRDESDEEGDACNIL